MKPLEAIRCTLPNCPCECFSPSKGQLRICDTCKHGWVSHALDKLGYRHMYTLGMQVEIVQPNTVFDIASLMLYGCQATPVRLKILLDRLFSVLQHEEVLQVLHGFGWSYEDYARGYILQDPATHVLDKWNIASREEEHIILQQFLRFGETKSIAQEIILQDTKDKQHHYVTQTARAESEIKKFIERTNISMQSYIPSFNARHLLATRMPYVHRGSRLMSPSVVHAYVPTVSPAHELRPPQAISTANTSPITTSPLGRLQTMQPFDYRRDYMSPAAISPGLPEKKPSPAVSHTPPIAVPSSRSCSPVNQPAFPLSRKSPLPMPEDLTMDSCRNAAAAAAAITTAVAVPRPQSLAAVMPSAAKPHISMHLPVLPQAEVLPNNDAVNYSTKNLSVVPYVPPRPHLHPLPRTSVVAASTSSSSHSSSAFADKKVKHMRKPSNPIKRQWTPSGAFGSTFISPSGKKRVLCTACNKTFCDKGALKIHYSAVHLKEMHKCSVEGCHMMFSSRRSRNRHSANPNPKLHMPQPKRKLTDSSSPLDLGSDNGRDSDCLIGPHGAIMFNSAILAQPLSPMDRSDVLTCQEQSVYDADSDMSSSDNSLSHSAGKKTKLQISLMNDDDDDDDDATIDNDLGCRSLPKDHISDIAGDQMEQAADLDDQSKNDLAMQKASTSRRKCMIPTRYMLLDDSSHAVSDDERDHDSLKQEQKIAMFQSLDLSMQSRKRSGSLNAHDSAQSLKHRSNKYSIKSEDMSDQTGCPSSEHPKISSLLCGPVESVPPHVTASLPGSNPGAGGVVSSSSSSSSRISHPSYTDLHGVEADSSSEHDSNVSITTSHNVDRGTSRANGNEVSDLSPAEDRTDMTDYSQTCTICSKHFPTQESYNFHYKNIHLKLASQQLCTVEGCESGGTSAKRHNSASAVTKLVINNDHDDKDVEEIAVHDSLVDENENMKDDDHYSQNVTQNGDNDGVGGPIKERGTRKRKRSLRSHPAMQLLTDMVADDSSAMSPHTEEENGTKDDENEEEMENVKENCEAVKEQYQCTIQGCERIFTTRKSRNRHSQNDGLHRNLITVKSNGVS